MNFCNLQVNSRVLICLLGSAVPNRSRLQSLSLMVLQIHPEKRHLQYLSLSVLSFLLSWAHKGSIILLSALLAVSHFLSSAFPSHWTWTCMLFFFFFQVVGKSLPNRNNIVEGVAAVVLWLYCYVSPSYCLTA